MATVFVSEAKLREAFEHAVEHQGSQRKLSGVTVRAETLIALLEDSLEHGGAQTEVSDECEEELPYAPMWVRRTPDGTLEQVCGHSPEHVTVLAPAR